MEGMKRWAGRVALVTGASTGIGEGICKELVKHGMKVIGCARNEEKLQKLALSLAGGSGTMHPFKCDVTNESEVNEMFDYISSKFDHLDICINNAGFSTNSPLLNKHTQPSEWRKISEVNVIAVAICSKKAVNMMESKKIPDGQIIQIDCVTGRRFPEGAVDGLDFYCATKSALRTLTAGLRREVRKSSTPTIRVASITPGAVETEFTERCLNKETADALYKQVTCLKPEDIAKAVTFILETPPHVEVNDIVLQPVEYTM